MREQPERRGSKWIKFDQKLQKIVEDFYTYTDVLDFLAAIGKLTISS